MRLWLGAAFAAVGVITAGTVFRFVNDSSEKVISDRSTELAVGRTIQLADSLSSAKSPAEVLKAATDQGFEAWFFNRDGFLVAPHPAGPGLGSIDNRRRAVATAQAGGRITRELPGDVTVVAFPVFDERGIAGAILGRYSRPEVLQSAIDRLREDSIRALAVGALIAILVGFMVSTAIAHRVKRLAKSASNMAAGELDVPLQVEGRDEIGDLARSLDAMRAALRDSFQVLSSERDRLAAIFDGLADAVMVVDNDGSVRFSNPAGAALGSEDGGPPEAMVPHLRRAAERGGADVPALRIGDRVYALLARDLPAEQAVLVVIRDRTDELRRELAEHEFVSNAAHELRNPLAGISGAIEVLQAGAKDDPEAREHFLRRLSEDVERMSRLTQSLLTLARVDTLGEGEAEPVDVEAAVAEAVAAVPNPDGLKVDVDLADELCAQGDPTLLRQVLVGLLSNAIKNTPPTGRVNIRGREVGGQVMLKVIDTGSGIPADEVDRVFERFYRASGSLAHEGFGLGLAIAKRMVHAMDGEIGAQSEQGSGSTFWVRLPVAEPTATPVA
ncbi:MAG: ATP-binding protein [Actinomycetota bacterium]